MIPLFYQTETGICVWNVEEMLHLDLTIVHCASIALQNVIITASSQLPALAETIGDISLLSALTVLLVLAMRYTLLVNICLCTILKEGLYNMHFQLHLFDGFLDGRPLDLFA
jgi:hypothetical protein